MPVASSATKSTSQSGARDVFLSNPNPLPRRRLDMNPFTLLEDLSNVDDDSNREHNPDSEAGVFV
jgi:hypothetical protein